MVTDSPSSPQLLGAGDVRSLVDEIGIRPTKKRGQNFVIDPNTVERIVRSAGLDDDDIVLEVGPGLGSLTLALLPHAHHVVAVEIDERLAERLPRTVRDRAPVHADKLTVIQDDALTINRLPLAPTALVANLPYNIAVPVVLHLLAAFPSIARVLVMVQKEVADRLVAGPGSKVYGVPSVKARWYGHVEAAGAVGTSVFWPAPHVESGLVRITRTAPPATTASREAVFSVIDAAFGQRRKSLRGALSGLAGSPAAAEEALIAARVDPTLRGEQLGVEDFARIAEALAR